MKKIIALIILVALMVSVTACGGGDTIVISRQLWAESDILANMTAIIIEENTDYNVDLKTVESNVIIWAAFESGQIDIWAGYTASLYPLFEEEAASTDPDEIYDYLKTRVQDFGITMLEPFGFENSYAMAITPELFAETGITTMSELAEISEDYKLITDINYFDRVDLYPALSEVYGLEFKDEFLLGTSSLKYETLDAGEADIIHVYTTDSGIAARDLVVLEDDGMAGIPFDAVYILQEKVLEDYPELEELLEQIKLDGAEMTALNYKVEVDGEDPEDVARDYLTEQGLIE